MVDRLSNHYESIKKGESWTPVKGIYCEHLKCQKFEYFIKENLQNIDRKMSGQKIWTCFCGKRAVDFVTDKFITAMIEIMRHVPKDEKFKENVLKEIKENIKKHKEDKIPQLEPVIGNRFLKPISSADFKLHSTGKNHRGKAAKSVVSRAKPEEDSDSHDDDCYNCKIHQRVGTRGPNVLLVCEGTKDKPCRRAQHVFCAGLKRNPPNTKWRCKDCAKKQ